MRRIESVPENIDDCFYSKDITDDIRERIDGKSYSKDCHIPYEELRYLRLAHIGFDGKSYLGEMIVNRLIADEVIEIFKKLYQAAYPIERMVLVDEYDGDDKKSMFANNTSAFNYRTIEGTNRLSLHSFGLAIDINPQFNPYINSFKGKMLILPQNGEEHVDRFGENPHYIRKNDICYKTFVEKGFTWGGDWTNIKDYHHFEKKLENYRPSLH